MQKIPIGRINNQRAALAFCDYLKTLNIHAWTEQAEGLFLILIDNEDAKTTASNELRAFLKNPSDSKYLEASWSEGSTQTNYSTEYHTKPSVSHFKSFLNRSGQITKILVIISVLVTFLTNFGASEVTRHLLIEDVTQNRGMLAEVLSGQIWRLLTPIFLHFMIIHILFNMMWLWDLGGAIEKNQSGGFLLFFVFSIGIMSNLVQYLSSGPAFGGMSGVVYGLLGYIWIRSLNRQSGYFLPRSIVFLMLGWLLLGYTGLIGPIGNAAHLSGLLFGVAYGFAWNQIEKK